MASALDSRLTDWYFERMRTKNDPLTQVFVAEQRQDNAEAELSLDERKIEFVKRLNVELAEAKLSGADGATVEGYRNMIRKYTGVAPSAGSHSDSTSS